MIRVESLTTMDMFMDLEGWSVLRLPCATADPLQLDLAKSLRNSVEDSSNNGQEHQGGENQTSWRRKKLRLMQLLDQIADLSSYGRAYIKHL